MSPSCSIRLPSTRPATSTSPTCAETSRGQSRNTFVYLATSTDGGNSFVSHKLNSDTGTHYAPWVAAGGNGGVDVVYYDTPYVEGVGALNKPAAAPSTAQWTVQMSQSLDGGKTWTQSNVSGHPVYFGDICTTGIFCGLAPDACDCGNDRILFDDFGVAVGRRRRPRRVDRRPGVVDRRLQAGRHRPVPDDARRLRLSEERPGRRRPEDLRLRPGEEALSRR